MKKRIATLLSLTLAFSTLLSALTAPVSVEAAAANESKQTKPVVTFKDVDSHWAKDKITEWAAQGVVSGASANEFKPNQQVTRAEWAAIVNRMFQLNEQQPQNYTDVQATVWYADAVNAATTAGYMKGYTDSTFKPNATLTRQEAVASLSRLLKWKTNNTVLAYKDSADIQPWATSSVSEAVYLGVVKGYEEGTFKPNQSLTRAEAVSILDRAFDTYGVWYGTAGMYGSATKQETINGNVIVNVPGITLQNLHIKGDLILTEGVGEGDVDLSKVKVDGETSVYGGGKNSIYVNDSVLSNVIVNKQNGTLRVNVKGTSTVQELVLQSRTIVDVQDSAKVAQVQLSEKLKTQSEVQLNGAFPSVTVSTYGSNLKLGQGSVQQLTVNKEAKGTNIETGNDTNITSLIINAETKVTGTGTIKQATINASGISFATSPKEWKLGENVSKDMVVVVAGKETKAGDLIKSTTTSGGAGGGAIGGGGSAGGVTPEKPNGNDGQGNNVVVKMDKEVFTVGEVVYGTIGKQEQGTVYIVQKELENIDVEEMEKASPGNWFKILKAETKPDGTFFSPGLFVHGEYVAIFVDSKKQRFHSQSFYLWKDINSVFTSSGTYQVPIGDDVNDVVIRSKFSHPLRAAKGVNLHQSVMIATYEEPTFKPLHSDIKVTINLDSIEIQPSTKLSNEWVVFKVLPNVVTSVITGESNMEVESYALNPVTTISFPGMYWNWKVEGLSVKKGDKIPMKVNEGNVFYLYESVIAAHIDIVTETMDREVKKGLAKKLVINSKDINEIHYMDTSGLTAGTYYIFSSSLNVFHPTGKGWPDTDYRTRVEIIE
ncbi:S-layer homology domain-containing protein [Paenibacillus arenosi]|uniref:S-layer homology domain-containing protein n=1 Tax=Paenibacillus arenosi TaxID=2774142 RepID=A0ABR9B3U4_9BACL|nr:S-layer homology domain-containing protein [Paenibacillus arenosi]MBD8499866.1 S-layer homology domain-containing protein [Paenibacillus arenosi]